MENTANRAIAIVGVGAILPDAPNVPAFWNNVKTGRYSITDVQSDRWNSASYFDADPSAPDKTYSKIGGWVREYPWDPMKWHLPIPPRVADGMDIAQKWAVACTREALEDYGYPKRPLDLDRTAVILGNAMAGEKHYTSSVRIFFPEYAHELEKTGGFANLPPALQREITQQFQERIGKRYDAITEDTMPGELANCMAGRIANLYNFHGPNYVCDAACASAMAAISSAVEGLLANDFDTAVTGGIDRNMGAPTFVKFCKIGALSATGTRPYAEGADGFVMGEGAAIFLIKRLADAERDQDKIYAVLRGIGASSDGKGKGITAPNPIGQRFCIERAWHNAGVSPSVGTLIEGHGTSTRVGDVVEAQSMANVLNQTSLPAHSVALGSVKSNIGHLKGAAGAAGPARQGAATQPALRTSQPRHRLFTLAAVCEHTTAAVGDPGGRRAARGRQRVRIWRHELPHGDGRTHSRQAEWQRQEVDRCSDQPSYEPAHNAAGCAACRRCCILAQSAFAGSAGARRCERVGVVGAFARSTEGSIGRPGFCRRCAGRSRSACARAPGD
jgi:acyl transferase domain-containing protein